MMSEMSRRIQKTKDMQIGLFGMILMSWCLILAIITKDSLDYWKVYWLECLIILFASFFFSIDLYWISTMNSYTLRRHYHYKWQFEPKGDIYSNVIITSKHFWEEDEIIQWTFV
ncbi:hypothetical protein CRE_01543 [Caenorhabditis remanei]|uniref:Uncharacterized protein n=1 Tax=Caenorhabditis remanei TaxID=31234 RepID=E3LGC4_CAERE|nr:hypothetical protein CRE_01543 [Caenorhabditis remanei]